MSEFVSVAETASLPPGHGRTVNVQGRELALWNVDGCFHAIDNECPHRGGPLGAGVLDGSQVSCPLHGWTFDVTTGECQDRPDRPVKTYPTRVIEGWVQVAL
jgi:nitrite reductase (NADH) small subunit/3-phenylpropionate/trans-cinnamate dioxygenase ferredoxin subunit